MTAAAQAHTGAPRVPARQVIVPSGVLAMLIFVITEAMIFAGFISAFVIAESGSTRSWPPPGQPRLPIEETALNSLALLASAVVLFQAGRLFKKDPKRAARPFLLAMLLGATFVLFQGVEWVALLGEGLTLTSSTHGSFFYMIVGAHALHAVAALGALSWVYVQMLRARATSSMIWTVQVFWYFVVGVWPTLYYHVYL